jgi:hypothetical protein
MAPPPLRRDDGAESRMSMCNPADAKFLFSFCAVSSNEAATTPT